MSLIGKKIEFEAQSENVQGAMKIYIGTVIDKINVAGVQGDHLNGYIGVQQDAYLVSYDAPQTIGIKERPQHMIASTAQDEFSKITRQVSRCTIITPIQIKSIL